MPPAVGASSSLGRNCITPGRQARMGEVQARELECLLARRGSAPPWLLRQAQGMLPLSGGKGFLPQPVKRSRRKFKKANKCIFFLDRRTFVLVKWLKLSGKHREVKWGAAPRQGSHHTGQGRPGLLLDKTWGGGAGGLFCSIFTAQFFLLSFLLPAPLPALIGCRELRSLLGVRGLYLHGDAPVHTLTHF